MPSYTIIHLKMQRDSPSTPWGFRMQGGRDFGCPLQIQKVNPNSLAERVGMQTNDYLLHIGSVSTEYLRHQEAQAQIQQHINQLELVLQRGAPPNSADYNNRVNLNAQANHHHHQPQVIMPISNNQVLVNQSYNTPIGLYSADNVNDTIARTLKSVNKASDHKIEESTNFNPPKPVQKPLAAPHKVSVPTAPKPFGAKPSAPRSTQKGLKGSALLNLNDNANQVATCHACGIRIRGPFISAISRCYCVDHFTCSHCSIDLMDCGFVEENGKLYCEKDFEQFLAPDCSKCSQKILKECIHALEKNWHPECFLCAGCKKALGSGSFHVEEGQPYCVDDYRRLFQAKCTGCEFPIEAGDKYLEAMGGTYHAECFNCSTCQVNLDGQGFIVKNDRPYCRQHGASRQVLSVFQ